VGGRSEMSHYSRSGKIEFDTKVGVLKSNGQHNQQPGHDAESIYNESLLGQHVGRNDPSFLSNQPEGPVRITWAPKRMRQGPVSMRRSSRQ
jgi:hypothetical protein